MSFLQDAKHIAITGGTQIAVAAGSTVTVNQGGQAGISNALKDLSAAAAHTALHDSSARFDAPRCHRNTRTTYLDGLERWMRGLASAYGEKRLIWINGGAGVGKSAIMQSIVERCAQHAVILGTFFFSRADKSRNYAEVLIPTLAYQLACDYPAAMVVLEPLIQRNPLIFKTSLYTQAEKLLVHPLSHLVNIGVIDPTSPLRRVFVIDGLDECDDREKQSHIIRVVATILCDYDIPVSFLIASRPETAISKAFRKENKVHDTLSSITLDNNDEASSDIRQFIEDSFLDILDNHPLRTHIPVNWPDSQSVDKLVQKSSGHFIYAATAMKFIASSDEHPARALQVIEGLAPPRMGKPFGELDALYLHILTSAKYASQVLAILRYCVLTYLQNSVNAVCFMYPHFSPQDIELFLSDVQALVSLSPNWRAELYISLKHASLTDFLLDKNRSDGIYMNAGDYRVSLLPRYFMLFDDSPQFSYPGSRSSSYVMDELTDAIRRSQDIGLLGSLIRMYSPRQVWNFYRGPSGDNDAIPANRTHLRNNAIIAVSSYLASIRNSAANHDNALYTHYFKAFVPVLIEDLDKLIRTEPQYQIIPALIFSSRQCCLTAVPPGLIDCFPRLIQFGFAYVKLFESMGHVVHMGADWKIEADPQAYEAIRTLPQAQMSWGFDMANALEFVLQNLLGYRWTPECLAPNPHQRWLNKVKPSKHASQGSPKLPSAVYSYLLKQRTPRNRFGAHLLPFCWVRGLYKHKEYTIQDKRWHCVVFLRTIIHYLHKCDLTSALAKLARRSLPKAALWFPRLMKKARRKMDTYVRRWDESPDGLLERAQSLAINEMD